MEYVLNAMVHQHYYSPKVLRVLFVDQSSRVSTTASSDVTRDI